jgi:hypothetical protein
MSVRVEDAARATDRLPGVALRANRRVAAACAGLTIGLLAAAIAHRAAARAGGRDADRQAYLDARLERMRAARIRLVSTRNGSAA